MSSVSDLISLLIFFAVIMLPISYLSEKIYQRWGTRIFYKDGRWQTNAGESNVPWYVIWLIIVIFATVVITVVYVTEPKDDPVWERVRELRMEREAERDAMQEEMSE
jgi:hypothetical protein